MNDSPTRPQKSSPRVVQLDALVRELQSLHPRTKADPDLERWRSLLQAHACAVRDTLSDLEKLRNDIERA